MRRILALIAGLVFLATSNAFAEFSLPDMSKRLPPAIFAEVSKIPSKPHFLLGLEPKTDEWEQYLEERKVFQTKDLFYGENLWGIIDKSRSDYMARGNTELTELLTVAGKNVRVVYTHHHFTKDGLYTFWSRTGEKNLAEFSPLYRKYEIQWALGKLTDNEWKDIQRVLGWAQFEAVKSFLHRVLTENLTKVVKDYQEINLTEGVIEAREKLLNDPRYRDRLDDPVPGTPGLKVRDILPVPLTRPEDFVPDLLIVGPMGFYGGFANWKTPEMERIVFYDMLGLALWYVSGWPMPEHELAHTNPYLQGIPLSFYYNIELWADLTTGLEDGGIMEFLRHFYMTVPRDMARVFFGYDYKEALRRIFPGGFGARDIREKEFREHAAIVKKIRDEILSFVKDPKDGLMVRFYTDPYFWTAVNTKFCDTSAVYRLLFALRYEPAGIFNPELKDKDGNVIPPVQQTKTWLMKEEEAGRIQRLAQEAMKGTGKESEFAKDISKVMDRLDIKCPVGSEWFLMKKEERERLAKTLRPIAERAKDGDVEALVFLSRIFGGTGALPRLPVR